MGEMRSARDKNATAEQSSTQRGVPARRRGTPSASFAAAPACLRAVMGPVASLPRRHHVAQQGERSATPRVVDDGAQRAHVVLRLASRGRLPGELRLEVANASAKRSDLFSEPQRVRQFGRLPRPVGADSLGIISPLAWPSRASLRSAFAFVRRHSVTVRDEIACDAYCVSPRRSRRGIPRHPHRRDPARTAPPALSAAPSRQRRSRLLPHPRGRGAFARPVRRADPARSSTATFGSIMVRR